MFQKILVANRGEIAVRILRTCRALGIPTAAVYSEADRTAMHVALADEAYLIGPADAAESYLAIDRILDAADRAGARAIHPGYGFLSENAEFAEACERAGVKFIGPSPQAIRSMGVKTRARELASAAGVPVVPGPGRSIRAAAEAAGAAQEIGYPVMLKAAAGGGGKGMRLVEEPEEIETAWTEARGEALQAFGDDSVYLEKAIMRPRHVEVQVLADEHGTVTHLGERECSLQRRHQKVLEEAPSPFLAAHPQVREALCEAAVSCACAADYSNAGTVEFLMDSDRNFYFLEMNTRLQVEHTVTELVTGIDMVEQQIAIAAGQRLDPSMISPAARGHAMQCRIYAEDPAADFMPSAGRINRLTWPGGPGIRVDSGAEQGWTVPVEYDPLIAKLCAWAPTRYAVIDRLRSALHETVIGGIATTLELFRALLDDPEFRGAEIDTGFLARRRGLPAENASRTPPDAELAAMLAALEALPPVAQETSLPRGDSSRWKTRGRVTMASAQGSVR